MYSTVLIEASVLRKSNISMYYPEIAQRYIQEIDSLLPEFPLLTLGCTARASNHQMLLDCLNKSINNNINLRSAQEKHLCLDGNNGKRVVDFIKTILT